MLMRRQFVLTLIFMPITFGIRYPVSGGQIIGATSCVADYPFTSYHLSQHR